MISEIFNRWYRAPEVMLNAKVSHGHLEPVLKGLIELVRADMSYLEPLSFYLVLVAGLRELYKSHIPAF